MVISVGMQRGDEAELAPELSPGSPARGRDR